MIRIFSTLGSMGLDESENRGIAPRSRITQDEGFADAKRLKLESFDTSYSGFEKRSPTAILAFLHPLAGSRQLPASAASWCHSAV